MSSRRSSSRQMVGPPLMRGVDMAVGRPPEYLTVDEARPLQGDGAVLRLLGDVCRAAIRGGPGVGAPRAPALGASDGAAGLAV